VGVLLFPASGAQPDFTDRESASDALKVTFKLPVGHGAFELLHLPIAGHRIKIDKLVAEPIPCRATVGEEPGGLLQGAGKRGGLRDAIGVRDRWGQLQTLLEALKPGLQPVPDRGWHPLLAAGARRAWSLGRSG